eukprot:scaffold7335_cov417-Prasinococcus_capsulatus_cf.AAC.20
MLSERRVRQLAPGAAPLRPYMDGSAMAPLTQSTKLCARMSVAQLERELQGLSYEERQERIKQEVERRRALSPSELQEEDEQLRAQTASLTLTEVQLIQQRAGLWATRPYMRPARLPQFRRSVVTELNEAMERKDAGNALWKDGAVQVGLECRPLRLGAS